MQLKAPEYTSGIFEDFLAQKLTKTSQPDTTTVEKNKAEKTKALAGKIDKDTKEDSVSICFKHVKLYIFSA